MGRWAHLYATARWRQRRAEQLDREPTCRLCRDLRGKSVPATVADHLQPHRGDPVLFEGPLQSLCAQCHSGWKQQQETAGRMRGCDANGRPLDPSHPWNAPAGGGGSGIGAPSVEPARLHRDE